MYGGSASVSRSLSAQPDHNQTKHTYTFHNFWLIRGMFCCIVVYFLRDAAVHRSSFSFDLVVFLHIM